MTRGKETKDREKGVGEGEEGGDRGKRKGGGRVRERGRREETRKIRSEGEEETGDRERKVEEGETGK